jgi:RNA polymerase sigma-70 factor (ECF subfamily)
MAETPRYRTVDDRELVIAFKAGEPGAYEEMYRRYSGRVGGVCRRMLSNPHDAQEAVQETFLKAYVALPQFNGNYRLGAWLGRIAANVCVDLLRARARSATVVPLQPDAAVVAVESSPEDVVVGDGPEVAEPMADIQPLHARALMMRGVEGLSHREIAGQLSMTPAQVKALLHRARRSFKRHWEEAKGWALAPVLACRAAARQLRSTSQAGSQIASATAAVGPALAERVAASAMIVAVLAGMPGSTASPVTRARDTHVSGRSHLSEWRMTAPRSPARHATGNAPKDTAERMRVAQTVESGRALVPALQHVLSRAHTSVAPPHEKHADKDDGDGLVPVTAQEAGAAAEKAVEEVKDLLPDS